MTFLFIIQLTKEQMADYDAKTFDAINANGLSAVCHRSSNQLEIRSTNNFKVVTPEQLVALSIVLIASGRHT